MSGKEDIKIRDQYIIERHKEGATPARISDELEKEGFTPLTRPRVYQILVSFGYKPNRKNYLNK